MASLLVGCGASPEETLNHGLPQLTIEQVLPEAVANRYCNQRMDTELLYGIGTLLDDIGEQLEAKNCMIMAAPDYPIIFCYLAVNVSQRQSPENNREAFNYLAYAASKNERCAEWALYHIYNVGTFDKPANKALSRYWLERAALDADQDSQTAMVELNRAQNNLPVAYAWARVQGDAEELGALKATMAAAQINAGDQHYNELLGKVIPIDVVIAQGRQENIAKFSADLHMHHPEAFEGLSVAERHAFMSKVVDILHQAADFSEHRQLYSYVLISRRAGLTDAPVDLWQNPTLRTLLNNRRISVEDTVAEALVILSKSQQQPLAHDVPAPRT